MPREDTQFKPGHAGGPGRPKGSRNKVSEAFLKDLYDVWQRRGMQVLERVADEDPARLMATVAQVLPKDFQVSVMDESTAWVINAEPLTIEEWQEKHGLLPEPS